MLSFSNMGHNITLMGMEEEGDLQHWAKKNNFSTINHQAERNTSWRYYFSHFKALLRELRKGNIELVFSHTQVANIVAVFVQFFSSARFVICRHHSDYIMMGNNKNAKRFDSIINKLGKEFIVPSRKVKEQMTHYEGVAPSKITMIPYAYEFEDFPIPDDKKVAEIRAKYSSSLLLVTVSRFIACKRYDLLINTVNDLVKEGKDIKLLILGNGPLEGELRNLVEKLDLNDRIIFIGFTRDVMNYLKAADLVVHTSSSEASNSVIKEAGWLSKPVIACHDVGDFDDYLRHLKNGLLISKENTALELKEHLARTLSDSGYTSGMGESLHKQVTSQFSASAIIPMYADYLKESR